MAEKKTTEKTADKDQQIADLEARLAKLEASQCPGCKAFKKFCKDGECKCPTQDEMREWIKENPFMAMGVAVILTAFVVGVIF